MSSKGQQANHLGDCTKRSTLGFAARCTCCAAGLSVIRLHHDSQAGAAARRGVVGRRLLDVDGLRGRGGVSAVRVAVGCIPVRRRRVSLQAEHSTLVGKRRLQTAEPVAFVRWRGTVRGAEHESVLLLEAVRPCGGR